MRKLLLGAAALALFASVAYAQNITTSLQGSQDPRGPVGLDANGNAYFGNHINAYGNRGTAPTASNCTGPCGTITGTDNAFTVASSGTTLNITFGQAFLAAPQCVLQEAAGSTAPTFTAYTTGIIATTVVSLKTYYGLCFGQD